MEYTRLLQCNTCKTLEALPDYEGPSDKDTLLSVLVSRHRFPDGSEHFGQLHKVEKKYWDSPKTREAINNRIVESANWTGLDPAFYAAKDTYSEDAMTCWGQHGRTRNCEDYKSDKKVLLPATIGMRRSELGQTRDEAIHASGAKRYLCEFCLTGDTEVVTREGIFKIAELAGKTPELLVPYRGKEGALQSRGHFVNSPVSYLGEQPTYTVHLRRGKAKKQLRTTAEHRWVLRNGQFTTTSELKPEDALKPIRAVPPRDRVKPVNFGVAQGFVFGDGGYGKGDKRPVVLPLYDLDKDSDILPFFEGQRITKTANDMTVIKSLPRHWKKLPPLDESRAFLLSWLAGYFAADGTVDKRGAASISSSTREHLTFVRDILAISGVGYGVISTKEHEGFGKPSVLYTLGIQAMDLPEWFFIITEHATRVAARRNGSTRSQAFHWIVESVEPTNEVESVYCATVDDVESFALADELLTGNCPMHSLVLSAQRKKAGLYD